METCWSFQACIILFLLRKCVFRYELITSVVGRLQCSFAVTIQVDKNSIGKCRQLLHNRYMIGEKCLYISMMSFKCC